MAMPSTSHALYDAICASGNEIRLFKFDPHSTSEAICGHLRTFNLDSCPSFDALSYEWGSVQFQSIQVNERPLLVRQNLVSFLQEFHRSGRPHKGWLWMDQICIDQQNRMERNHQVSLMQWIYSRARMVYAWLGPKYEESLRSLLRLQASTNRMAWESNLEWSLAELDMLSESSYWSRLWIQQELLLAQAILFITGGQPVSATSLAFLKAVDFELPKANFTLMSIFTARPGEKRDVPRCIVDILREFCLKECADARDKVFGLQAMVHPNDRITINYAWSTIQVLENTVASLTRTHGGCGSYRHLHPSTSWEIPRVLHKLGMAMGLDSNTVERILIDGKLNVRKVRPLGEGESGECHANTVIDI